MKKVRLHFVLFWVALFLFWYTAATEGKSDNFDTRLIVKLTELMKVETPTTILVERLEQKEMLDEYRSWVMTDCMSGGRMERFQYCSGIARQATTKAFVHGLWVEKKDSSNFHIKVFKHSGIDVVIHEYLHWYLHYSTKPHGLVNNHDVLTPMVTALLTSEELIDWLDKEGK